MPSPLDEINKEVGKKWQRALPWPAKHLIALLVVMGPVILGAAVFFGGDISAALPSWFRSHGPDVIPTPTASVPPAEPTPFHGCEEIYVSATRVRPGVDPPRVGGTFEFEAYNCSGLVNQAGFVVMRDIYPYPAEAKVLPNHWMIAPFKGSGTTGSWAATLHGCRNTKYEIIPVVPLTEVARAAYEDWLENSSSVGKDELPYADQILRAEDPIRVQVDDALGDPPRDKCPPEETPLGTEPPTAEFAGPTPSDRVGRETSTPTSSPVPPAPAPVAPPSAKPTPLPAPISPTPTPVPTSTASS